MVLLILLVLANITTIGMYWLGRKKPLPNLLPPPPKQMGPPSEFLIKELALDSIQKAKYLDLVKIHQTQTTDLREKIRTAKDQFFDLIKQPVLNDSIAKKDVTQISILTTQQDMATLQHFRQVRALCSLAQQQKFDSVIYQMLGIMAQQRPNLPPPNRGNGEKLPPDDKNRPIQNGQNPPPDKKRLPPPDGRRPPPNGQRPPPPNGDGPPPDGPPPPPPERQNRL